MFLKYLPGFDFAKSDYNSINKILSDGIKKLSANKNN
jgi:hypothetical protein